MTAADDYPNLANLTRWQPRNGPCTVIACAPFAEQATEALDELDRLRDEVRRLRIVASVITARPPDPAGTHRLATRIAGAPAWPDMARKLAGDGT